MTAMALRYRSSPLPVRPANNSAPNAIPLISFPDRLPFI
jgi:hypothetical protein